MRRRSLSFVFVLLAFLAGGVSAQDASSDGDTAAIPAPSSSTVELQTIVVSGSYAGPGLWKVHSGEHTLWILGVENPLPKRMEWESSNVERKIAASQAVLLPPHAELAPDVGFFRGMLLLPSLLKARKNPDGKTLRDMVSPEQYQRWSALKQRYIGGDRGVEEWRPLFAALELYNKAIERSGMTQEGQVSDTVKKLARHHDVPTIAPEVSLKVKDPKSLLQDFAKQSLDDTECFGRMLTRIESDLGLMASRANAWAEGDVATLRDLRSRSTQLSVCRDAVTGNAVAKRAGFADIEERLEREWMSTAENALAKNMSTFAVLPMNELLQPDGYLAKLAAKGYVVEAP